MKGADFDLGDGVYMIGIILTRDTSLLQCGSHDVPTMWCLKQRVTDSCSVRKYLHCEEFNLIFHLE